MKTLNKVFIITNIPTPYRIPLFNEIKRQLDTQGIELKIIFGSSSYKRRKWEVDMTECNFEYEILSSLKIFLRDPEKTFFTYSGLLDIVKKERPDLIVVSGFSLATVKLWWKSWFNKIPYIIWSEAIERQAWPDPKWRKFQRKVLIQRTAAFIAGGTKARDYLIEMGADEKKVYLSYSTTDLKFFQQKSYKQLLTEKKRKNILYLGYVTKGKRIDQLFYVIKLLFDRYKNFILTIVGEGPEVNNLKKLARKLDITSIVQFEGYKQKDAIPAYFTEADCFVFPSEYDIWGLVINEAMAAGLPCIVSTHAGAAYDLIEDGVTGFLADFSHFENVAEKIQWVFEHPEAAKAIGSNASQFIVKNASIEKSAGEFVNAILSAWRINTT